MIHLETAVKTLYSTETDKEGTVIEVNDFVSVTRNVIAFAIQDGPVGDAGVNGIQVTDMLNCIKEVYKSLNNAFPCRENSLTITKIEEAIHWQDARTKDRENRNVEGKSEA